MTKHPLFHFLAFGILLAIVFLVVAGFPADGEEDRRIVISDNDLTQMRAAHFRQWKREPTPEEMRNIIDRYVREEVLYREALARGLDKNDMTVRRAMAQKMEFIGSSQARGEDPTEEEVEAYFALRRERYRRSGLASFIQVYFNADNGNTALAIQKAESLLERVKGKTPEELDLGSLGDPLMLEKSYSNKDERQITAMFGDDFMESIMTLPVGEWTGPVVSGYGQHIVYITDRQASEVPDWKQVESAIRQDMEREAVEASRELFYTEILRNFEVVYSGEATAPEDGGEE